MDHRLGFFGRFVCLPVHIFQYMFVLIRTLFVKELHQHAPCSFEAAHPDEARGICSLRSLGLAGGNNDPEKMTCKPLLQTVACKECVKADHWERDWLDS